MSAKITIKNIKSVLDSITKKSITNLTTPQLRKEIGKFVEAQIKVRTLGHVDADNKPFIPYTPKYKKFRIAKGRGTNVNLLFTGRMLASIKSTNRGNNKVIIRIGEKKKSVNNNKRRKFFAVNQNDAKVIKLMLINKFKEVS